MGGDLYGLALYGDSEKQLQNTRLSGTSVLADIVMQKFSYLLPFYRVILKYRKFGVAKSDSTMNNWFTSFSGKPKPVYDTLWEKVLDRGYNN